MRPCVPLAVALATTLACGGATGTDVPEIASVAMLHSTYDLGVGASLQIEAVAYDRRNNRVDGVTNMQWTSADPSIISVDGNGIAHALKLGGPVTVTVSSGGKSASTAVRATPFAVVITPAPDSLSVGQSVQLSAIAKDFTGNTLQTSSTSWSIANGVGATVSSTGLLTATGSGLFVVQAVADGKAATMETGVHSQYDGSWVGITSGFNNSASNGGSRQVRITIRFGTIVYFQIADIPAACNQSILWQFITQEQSPIIADQFRLPGYPISGTFTSPTELTGSFQSILTGMQIVCAAGANPIAVNLLANTYTATKQ